MIKTGRLLLRAAVPEDLEPLHAVFSDPRAMRYWDRPPHQDMDQTQRFLDHFIASDLNNREEYILEVDGVCVGKAGMWRRFEIGYILHPDLWGRGLVTEALSTIIPRVFERFPEADKVTAELDPRNLGSIKVLEKQGFERVGFAEKNFLYGETEWCDTAYYSLTRP
ncbi:GNAT family N-acetyltransferase [uncultured Pelagimonas sp.]|uniref:GNAT family N-acetyltransferase n=1 Tax=uncultured Pelagimonas sp. TaxID=1618102 RepID=UPI002611DEAD|nr:GNAT family N-acetyltransferase [uncultured Pelagimonas sp.]